MVKKIQEKKEYFIQFSDEELEKLSLKENEKYSMEILDDKSIKMTPFAKIDIDISEWNRETLEHLIAESVEKDISINEVISQALDKFLKNYGND